jgi:invasion protein IalB
MRFQTFLTLAVAVGFMTTSGSMAQDAPSASTATYGDWTQRCAAASEEAGAAWRCEISHTVTLRETGATLLEIAIGQLEDNGPVSAVFQVPNSVWLRTPIAVLIGEAEDAQTIAEASYFRCSAQVCLADLQLNDELIAAFKSDERLFVSIEDGGRRTVRLPISLNGFEGAFAATINTADTPDGSGETAAGDAMDAGLETTAE